MESKRINRLKVVLAEKAEILDKDTGYVYILTNPGFLEDWLKIGKSLRPVDVRSKKLDIITNKEFFDVYGYNENKAV